MLYEIEILETRRIAELAAAARDARDRAFTPLREAELGEPPPARGEHHAAGTLGFAGVPGEPARQALQSRASLRRLFRRTHEFESVDNLFAIRMLVDLARGLVGEFVLVIRRHRIAEHQRVYDPDCTWLHCLPPPR